jgi:hypothetical protein
VLLVRLSFILGPVPAFSVSAVNAAFVVVVPVVHGLAQEAVREVVFAIVLYFLLLPLSGLWVVLLLLLCQ